MIIMPSNNKGSVVMDLMERFPDKLAFLQTPQSVKPSVFNYKYAIDNGAFSQFHEKDFFNLLDKTLDYDPPMFVAVPDVLGCHSRTVALWCHYTPVLREYGYPLAFVAQDGCTPEGIPVDADWIFVGGKDPWKDENIHRFVGLGRPVHVGRVNTRRRLIYCDHLGVASVDGTGWIRQRGKQFVDFMEYVTGVSEQLKLF
jgi:hypothetical protein